MYKFVNAGNIDVCYRISKEREEQFLKKHEKGVAQTKSHENTGGVEECLTLESAHKRNQEILKNLEMFKARFRSRATYSPVQGQLEKLKALYREKLDQEGSSSVPTSIKKTYGPTFV